MFNGWEWISIDCVTITFVQITLGMVWIHHFSPRLYIKVGQTEILALDGKQSRERTALNLKSYTILVRYIWYSHLKDYRVDNSLRCKLVGSKVSIEVDEEEEEFYYIFSLLLLYIASKATKKKHMQSHHDVPDFCVFLCPQCQ